MKLLIATLVFIACTSFTGNTNINKNDNTDAAKMTIYDFTIKGLDGGTIDFSKYKGKKILVVNTASKCGFTPQYEGLEKLWESHKDDGLVILGFPCNQFGSQEPGNADDIEEFCQVNYGVTFPMFDKIDVNGPETHPLYTWLKDSKSGLLGGKIK